MKRDVDGILLVPIEYYSISKYVRNSDVSISYFSFSFPREKLFLHKI